MITANQTAPSDELVDWKPVAKRLGLKERAFWDALYKQGIPHYRINSRVLRFKMSEVEEWLESRRIGASI